MSHPKATLHILNKAPDHPRFGRCLSAIHADDLLVLTEDAVLAMADTSLRLPAHWQAIDADARARSIGTDHAGKLIGYADLVQLTEHHSRIISW